MANATDVVDLISRDTLRAFPPAQLTALAEMLGQIAGMHAANS